MVIYGSQYTVKYASNLFCHSNATKTLIIDGLERYTGEQLNREARSISQAFQRFGVSKGDTVALIGASSCRFYAAYLAVHKLGAVACNIHVRESTVYITRTLEKVQAKLVVSEEKLVATVAESLAALGKPVPLFSLGDDSSNKADAHYRTLIEEYPSLEPEVEVLPDDPAVIILSSGSTGTPKGIVHSNANFVRWLRVAPALFGAVSRSTRFLVNVGTSFAAWPFSSIPILYAGGCIILMENFTPEGFCQAVESDGATMAGPVPTMIRLLKPSITQRYDLSSLKMILCAGEPPSESDIDRVLSWSDTDIRCLYLASESAPGAGTFWELDDAINLGKKVCAGKPVPGAEIRIVDPLGSIADPLPAGTEGEILLKGPTVAMCYLGDEELTRQKFCDGWWRSGDLGSLDEDGYLTVSGRTDNIINTGGIKVHAEEVENCLIGHPCVSQVAVIGIPDKKWGLRIEAHVSRSDDVSADELRQWCQVSGLASFKQPKKYVFHHQLPAGVTGKLDRVSLREKYKDTIEESRSGSA